MSRPCPISVRRCGARFVTYLALHSISYINVRPVVLTTLPAPFVGVSFADRTVVPQTETIVVKITLANLNQTHKTKLTTSRSHHQAHIVRLKAPRSDATGPSNLWPTKPSFTLDQMADSQEIVASTGVLIEKPNVSDNPPGRVLTSVSRVSSLHQPSITTVFH